MKKNVYTISGIVFILILSLSSCRSTDTENTLAGVGASSVNINLLGSEYSNNGSLSASASLDQGKNLFLGNETQRNNILISPSKLITIELSPSTESSKISTQASVQNQIAAIPGNTLGAGIMFRVIAYRQSNGNFHTYQDYTIGQTATPMMLDNGAAYNIVCYSYGTSSLPAISAGEQTNISSAQVNYDDNNRDFMYQNIAFTPNNYTNNTLNITLRHKVAQITTILNSVGLGNITAISGGILSPHYSNGVYSLSSGVMSGRTTSSSGAILNFSSSGFPGVTQTADPVFVNADTGGSVAGSFSASVTIGGKTNTINLPNSFKITPENKSNLTINLQNCGAYLGPGNTLWKDFMCHNMGADNTADSFAPSAAIHGAKYQWGANTNEVGRYYSQANDQSNSAAIAGWNTTGKANGSWSDASKTATDPCPTGFRVPTQAQWQAVINNNVKTSVGSTWTNSPTNYGTAVKYGNLLFLPTTGYRDPSSGSLDSRGYEGYYWSSTGVISPNSYLLYVGNTSGALVTGNRTYGISVRCIAQ
ncbi:MAG: fibrobacter succinogenes major paralogous domain-containing protein [Flavobacteriaceae bacterium]|jgi:uncharacterized protein (TIGR02145 family)|nr:fibrobacter succinogenes major paralogous domain-containing protein [Flavobacteriaceae bacterium]